MHSDFADLHRAANEKLEATKGQARATAYGAAEMPEITVAGSAELNSKFFQQLLSPATKIEAADINKLMEAFQNLQSFGIDAQALLKAVNNARASLAKTMPGGWMDSESRRLEGKGGARFQFVDAKVNLLRAIINKRDSSGADRFEGAHSISPAAPPVAPPTGRGGAGGDDAIGAGGRGDGTPVSFAGGTTVSSVSGSESEGDDDPFPKLRAEYIERLGPDVVDGILAQNIDDYAAAEAQLVKMAFASPAAAPPGPGGARGGAGGDGGGISSAAYDPEVARFRELGNIANERSLTRAEEREMAGLQTLALADTERFYAPDLSLPEFDAPRAVPDGAAKEHLEDYVHVNARGDGDCWLRSSILIMFADPGYQEGMAEKIKGLGAKIKSNQKQLGDFLEEHADSDGQREYLDFVRAFDGNVGAAAALKVFNELKGLSLSDIADALNNEATRKPLYDFFKLAVIVENYTGGAGRDEDGIFRMARPRAQGELGEMARLFNALKLPLVCTNQGDEVIYPGSEHADSESNFAEVSIKRMPMLYHTGDPDSGHFGLFLPREKWESR